MKKIIIIICFLWSVMSCMAQQGYVELDSITHVGIKTIDQGKRQNALSCQWQQSKDVAVHLTPYEVKSYAVDGKVYVAKDIEINGAANRLFLEKMVAGKLTLFFIQSKNKHFFIEKNSALFELTKRDASGKKHYRETLQAWCSDCDHTENFLKHTWYNRFYLKRFVRRYNICEEVYRPIRVGIIGGWDLTGYPMLKDAWGVSATPSGSSFTFGAFADIPVLQSKVSFHPEVLYSKQAYQLTEILTGKHEKEGIANIETCSVPLLFRYTWWTGKCSPFLNLGTVWYHYSRLENSVLTANYGILDIQTTEPELSPSKYAVTGGVGVWYKISRRSAVFVEARATYNSDRFTCNIFTGINF